MLVALAEVKSFLHSHGMLRDDRGLWQDDFESPGSGWTIQAFEKVSAGYVDGEYQVAVMGSDDIAAGLSPYGFSDAEASVEGTATVETAGTTYRYGVVCRAQRTAALSGYFFSIGPDGTYQIAVLYGSGRTEELAAGADAAVIAAAGEPNQVEVSCVGDVLALAVNGSPLAEATDTTYSTGSIALAVVGGGTTPVVATFDDLVVLLPDPGGGS